MSVGMFGKDGCSLVAKEWRIETTSQELIRALSPYRCSGGHHHAYSLGTFLGYTACYTPFMGKLIAYVLLATYE